MIKMIQRVVKLNVLLVLLASVSVQAQLFLVGDATPGGWDLSAQTAMTQDGENLYSWTGTLTNGSFKIKTYAAEDFCGGDWVHPLTESAPVEDAKVAILLGCDGGNPDYKWVVSGDTTLTISVNLSDSTISFSEPQQEVSPELFLVGDATPSGWDLSAQTVMTQDGENLYSWTGTLTSGSFKIKTYAAEDFCGGDWVHPLTESAPVEDAKVAILLGCDGGNPDYKWAVSGDTTLTISVNLSDSTISFSEGTVAEKAELFLVGDATPGGWDLSAQTAMETTEDSVFSWTGTLTSGSFKIKTYASQEFCDGNWVHPLVASAPIENAAIDVLPGCAEGNPDNQWAVTSDTMLTVIVDLKNKNITFSEVQDDPESTSLMAYMVGSATPGGWDLGMQTPMMQSVADNNVFVYSDTLKVGEFKIKLYEENDFCAGDWMHPLEASQSLELTSAAILLGCSDGNPDYKWEVTEPGLYTVTANIADSIVSIVLDEAFNKTIDQLFIVGDATAAGWDLSAQLAMVQDEEDAAVFTWKGLLSIGELKIKTFAETDWCAGEWIHPFTESAPLTSNEFTLLIGCAETNPDYKWSVAETDTGEYMITVNLDSSSIDFEKLSISSNKEFETTIVEYKLLQNYPNPFNPTTNIGFEIPEYGKVRLNVYDMLGRKVATLINKSVTAGAHTVTFDASALSSGMYVYLLETPSGLLSRKMMLIK